MTKSAAKYDAVVVGAGPAGTIAAYELAHSGCSVLLIEKHHTVGKPVCCAEGITIEGLTQVVPVNPRWIARAIDSVYLVGPNDKSIKLKHPDAGYILDRTRLEQDLAARAEKAGAELWTDTEAIGLNRGENDLFNGVELSRNGEQFTVGCKIVIGCDGVESLVGRWAGIDTLLQLDTVDSAAQYLLGDLSDIDPSSMEFYLSREHFPGGYGWVFPKSETTANVGLGIMPTLAKGKSAVTRLDEFVARRFGKAAILARTGGAVPAFHGRKIMRKNNVLLAGDAARLLDSMTGGGIGNALLSGMYAGRTAAEYLQTNRPDVAILKKYPDRFMRHKGRELRYLLYARQIFVRMTDDDFDDALDVLHPLYGGKTFHHIDAVEIVKQILRARPRLLTLARHLLW